MIKVKHLTMLCCIFYVSYLYQLITPVSFHNEVNAAVIPSVQVSAPIEHIAYFPKAKLNPKKSDKVLIQYVLENSDECNYAQAKQIVSEVSKYKDPLLLLSVIKVESNFDRKAVSKKKAAGLGQIMRLHVKDLKKNGIISRHDDLFKINPNIKATSHILETYREESKSIPKALARYGNSKQYVKKVYKEYSKLVVIASTNNRRS